MGVRSKAPKKMSKSRGKNRKVKFMITS